MPKPRTAIDYAKRLGRVAAHIAEHLDDSLPLSRLAAVANLSEFHFHRLYRELTGETVAEALRRLRLHRAAGDLVAGGLPIARVARRAGYGSAAAFTRAFAAAYGMAPAAYRRRRGAVAANPVSRNQEVDMHEVQIREFPARRLAALRHHGAYLDIGGTFDRLLAWAGPRGLMTPGTRCLGLYYDDPQSVPAAKLRSDACLTLPPGASVEGEIRIVEQPAARCAVARHKGPYAELERTYRWLYRSWLPQSGHEPADQPCFEEYVNDPRTLPPTEWLTDVCVPLRL
ncbi:MAG: AraC family transcriptional regulator [Alphaproteobacteria bacterium]|nr:AraC family transcriptional regulator [Alphaproteobacteria bacterium]